MRMFYLYILTFGPQLQGIVVEISHHDMGQPFENTLFLCSLVDRGCPFVIYHYMGLETALKYAKTQECRAQMSNEHVTLTSVNVSVS